MRIFIPAIVASAALFALPALLAPPATAQSNPATATQYEVQAGDTLGGVANRTGVDKNVIAAANGLVEPYDLEKGRVLQIPRQRFHTVKAGDTGLGIANRYGVPLRDIAVANALKPPYALRTGQRLIIPAVMAAVEYRPQKARTEPYFRRPHDGRVMAGYSLRANGRGHDGIDYAANLGDMVRASASGTVVFADREPKRFGRLVVIDHGNGWRTRYGHLGTITVKLGEVVKTGERIGTAGQAGVATRPELHFEIMRNNVRIDPARKLPQR